MSHHGDNSFINEDDEDTFIQEFDQAIHNYEKDKVYSDKTSPD